MQIVTGLEKSDGTFKCVPCVEARPGETALQALERAVETFYGKKQQMSVRQSYTRIGPHNDPTETLPAVFVGKGATYRGFFISTKWDSSTKQWVLG